MSGLVLEVLTEALDGAAAQEIALGQRLDVARRQATQDVAALKDIRARIKKLQDEIKRAAK